MRGAAPWLFVVLMLGLTALFAGLGIWQVNRLAEKEALIATVAARETEPPGPFPAFADWPGMDPEAFNFRSVTITGEFSAADTILVFTSLSDARGDFSGPGYWVIEPLKLPGGGAVFINRGFVPQERKAEFAAGGNTPLGEQVLTGVARVSELVGSFTPAADAADRIEWVRNIDRMAQLVDPAIGPFAPLYIDLPAGAPGTLPQGGETVVEFPNNHFGYALTWFGFAILTPVLLAFWLVRQRQKPKTP